MPYLRLIALAAVLTIAATACGGDDSPTATPGGSPSGVTDPAETIAVFAGPEQSRALLAAAKDMEGVHLYLLSNSSAGDGAFDPAALPSTETRGARLALPDNAAFRERFSAAYQHPDAEFPGFRESYDSVYLVALAAIAAGSADPAALRDNFFYVANAPGDPVAAGPDGLAAAAEALNAGADINPTGVSGPFDFASSGAASKATAVTWAVLNGAVAPLEIRDVDLAAETGAENPPGQFTRPGEPALSGPLRIGAILPLSGGQEAQGAAIRDAMQLAADEINEAGGVHGQPIELAVQDDGGNPDSATALAGALRDEGVSAVIGPFGDEAALAVASSLGDNDALPVIILSPSPAIDAIQKPSLFRATPSRTMESVVLAGLATDRELTVACVLRDDTAEAGQMAAMFRTAFEKDGGGVRDPVTIPADDPDYAGLINGCLNR